MALSLLNQVQPCLSQPQLKQIQSHLTISGTLSDPFAAGKLIGLFAIPENSDLRHAHALFRLVPHRSTYMWNTMIRAFTEKNQPQEALFLYREMVRSGFLMNNYTFSFVFRACCEVCGVSLGLMCHAQVVKLGWEGYDFVQNGLIHFYASSNCVDYARKLFDMSRFRDVITWTSLVNGYLKCGEVGMARELFDQMPEKNAVTWSAMINGYAQVGLFKEGLELFNDMLVAGVRPNHAGIVGALCSCAFLGALGQGRWIHAYVERNRMEIDKVLGTALVDMYAKCGCIEMACHVFEEMPQRDLFAYTSLISGLADHGEGVRALEVFERMKNEGVRPNEVTFIGVLSACSRIGSVDKGLRIFESMEDVYGIGPGVQHYGCLVDLLGRAGRLEQAKEVVRTMPTEPDSYVLGALLNACRVHGDIDLSKEVVKGLVERSLDHSGVHVILSNIYAAVDQWDYAEKVRKTMKENQVNKVPGCSLIEVDGMVCEFVAGDRSHVQIDEIEFVSLGLDRHLKSLWLDDYALAIKQLCLLQSVGA